MTQLRQEPGVSIFVMFSSIGGTTLGKSPSDGAITALGLPKTAGAKVPPATSADPLAALLPLLTHLPTLHDSEPADSKPSRVLVAKGLPTLPRKVVEKAWSLEFVEMLDFLPTPRALRVAELGGHSQSSLQGSLVGALNEFQAMQRQQQRAQRQAMDIYTWTRCFTLYMAVVSKKVGEMIPQMVAHLHTVLKLNRKSPSTLAWREYDVQFRMEMAAREDRVWTPGDPWQYLACLPSPGLSQDPFEATELSVSGEPPLATDPRGPQEVANSNTKRRQDSSKGKQPAGGAAKRPKKAGLCRLLNSTPGGCPYGNECIFVHRCSNCGVFNDHGQAACTKPPRPLDKSQA